MNAKLLLKTLFLVIVVVLLVLIGMHNQTLVSFRLPPLLVKAITTQAAIMYIAFFAVGLITGTILTAGGGGKKGGGSARSSKSGDK